jgi:hypothetical protein
MVRSSLFLSSSMPRRSECTHKMKASSKGEKEAYAGDRRIRLAKGTEEKVCRECPGKRSRQKKPQQNTSRQEFTPISCAMGWQYVWKVEKGPNFFEVVSRLAAS